MALGGGTWSPTVAPLRVPKYTPFSPKSVKNGQKGVPPFLTHFREGYHLLGTPPPPSYGPSNGKFAPQVGSLVGGGEFITS